MTVKSGETKTFRVGSATMLRTQRKVVFAVFVCAVSVSDQSLEEIQIGTAKKED